MNSHDHAIRARAVRRAAPRPFLEETSLLRVRFNEVDALHIAWHGHYANYFEEARRAFGRRFDMDYPLFLQKRVGVPVIHLEVNFLAPARLQDTLAVTARLLKSESARLDFDYEIRRESDGTLLATGSTSQVFTTPTGELILNWPPFMLERLKTLDSQWQQP